MAGGVPAGRLSIELVAEIARLQQDLDKAKRLVKSASNQIASDAKAANDNLRNVGAGGSPGLQQFSRDVAALKGQLDPSFAALQKYKEQVGLLRKALGEGAISHKQFVEQMRGAVAVYKGAGTEIAKTGGVSRVFGQQLSQVGQQVAAGTNALQALAIQLPDIAIGMSQAGGAAGRFGAILGGPWAIAITTGLALLLPFISKLWETGDAAKKAEKSLDNMASAAARAQKATATNALIQQRSDLLSQKALLGTGAKGGVKSDLEYKIDKEVAALDRQINANAKLIGMWNERAEVEGRQEKLNERITVATDKNAAATQRHTAALKALNAQRVAGKISDDEYVRQGAALQRQLDAVTNSDRNAAAATRGRNKELREAAKAARDAAKAAKEYEKSVLGGAALRDLRNMTPVVSTSELDQSLRESAKAMQDELDRRRDAARDISEFEKHARAEADRKSRDIFRDAARDFADVIGGAFGSAIDRLAAALDRWAPDLAAQIGGAKLGNTKLGGLANAALGGAAVGAGIGSVFSSLGIGNKKGGMIGGLVAGPAGAIVGSILGGILSGVKKASATIEITAGKAVQSSLTGNSSKLKKAAGAMADSLMAGLIGIADQLGGMLGDGLKVSIGQRDKTFRVDLAGLGRTKNMPKFDTEQEAIEFAISELLKQGAITGLRAGTAVLLKGAGDLEARLQNAMKFEGVFKELEQRANPAIAALSDIAKEFDKLIDIFEEANATAEDYAKLQELMAIKQREALEQAFEPIRSMLDDLKAKAETAGEAVRAAYDDVLSRETEAIATYQELLGAQEAAARDAQRGAIQSTIAALESGISDLQKQAEDFAQAAGKLRDFSAGIFGGVSGRAVQFSAQGVADAAGAGDIDALQRFRDAAISSATDRVSMMRNLAVVMAETDKAASALEKQAGGLNSQIQATQRQVEIAQAQLDAIGEGGETLLSIDEALANMQTAVQAADEARALMAGLGELTQTQTTFAEAVAAYEAAKAERDDLIRTITEAGFAGLIEAQKQTASQMVALLVQATAQAAEASAQAAAAIAAAQAAQVVAAAQAANDNYIQELLGRIPYFAAGGAHSGGLRIVGERGPELEATGPARYYSANRTSDMLGGPSAADIGAAVRAELQPILYPMAKAMTKLDDRTRRWDGDGMPTEREVA